ncbi:MAG: hypothetical protein LBF87_04925 [Treponema sp.]|nr:hypothetical protein [Treponema sp.]
MKDTRDKFMVMTETPVEQLVSRLAGPPIMIMLAFTAKCCRYAGHTENVRMVRRTFSRIAASS